MGDNTTSAELKGDLQDYVKNLQGTTPKEVSENLLHAAQAAGWSEAEIGDFFRELSTSARDTDPMLSQSFGARATEMTNAQIAQYGEKRDQTKERMNNERPQHPVEKWREALKKWSLPVTRV